MAEFLTTAEITARIESIIGDAKKYLLLISPYLSVNERLRKRIEDKASSGVGVHIIYRHKEQEPEVSAWLESLTNVETSFCENLHAKCYLNEREAILTSMNLYEFSQVNNYEMGVLISNNRDAELFRKALKEVKHIRDVSTRVRKIEYTPFENPSTAEVVGKVLQRFGSMLVQSSDTVPRVGYPESSQSGDTVPWVETPVASPDSSADRNKRSSVRKTRKESKSELEILRHGYCIRCGIVIPVNPIKPYCNRCYTIWNRYQNEDYQEKVCHLCRNEYGTTMPKPACLPCYRKYRNVLEFAAN